MDNDYTEHFVGFDGDMKQCAVEQMCQFRGHLFGDISGESQGLIGSNPW